MAFTTSGQEMEWAYSYSPGAHMECIQQELTAVFSVAATKARDAVTEWCRWRKHLMDVMLLNTVVEKL